MVLAADFFHSLRHVILSYDLHSKEYIWSTDLDCLNEGMKKGSCFTLASLLRFFSLC